MKIKEVPLIFTIHDPIYVQDVIVAIGEPRVSSILRAVVQAGYCVPNIEEMGAMLEMGTSCGRTVIDSASGAVVIRLNRLRPGDPRDVSHLVHECVHAATMLFNRIGFPISSPADEPLAYYVAFLVREVLSRRKAWR